MLEPALPRFLVSLFLMLVPKAPLDGGSCASTAIACPLAMWMLRASKLGALLEAESGRDVVIDAYTPCMPAGERETKTGVTIRTHNTFPQELTRVISTHTAMSSLAITLLKWVAVSLVDAEWVACFDLDMDILMPMIAAEGAVAADWLNGLRRMQMAGAVFGARRDHSSPINAGFMVLKPNATMCVPPAEEFVSAVARVRVVCLTNACGEKHLPHRLVRYYCAEVLMRP